MSVRSLFTNAEAPKYTIEAAPPPTATRGLLTYDADSNTCSFEVPVGMVTAYLTADNLAGTTLNNGGDLALGYTGLVTLTSSTGFATSGYVRIADEIIEYDDTGAGANQINLTTRGFFGTTDVLHPDGSNVGEIYQSGILDLSPYTQVATTVQCDTDCSMWFIWYSDAAATQEIRSLSRVFTVAEKAFDYLAAPKFGPYVRYAISPSAGASTTSLFFSTDFTKNSLSAQLLTLEDTVFSSMVSQVSRSVMVGQANGSGLYENVKVTSNRELLSNTFAADNASCVAYEDALVAADTYVLLVDLDNSGGQWPHVAGIGIDVDHLSLTVNFAANNSVAVIRIGIITRVDGTDADISYLINERIGVATAKEGVIIVKNFQPSSVHFHQSGGSLVGALSPVKELAVAAVNTGLALASPAGTTVPAVGDLVMKLDFIAGNWELGMNMLYHSHLVS